MRSTGENAMSDQASELHDQARKAATYFAQIATLGEHGVVRADLVSMGGLSLLVMLDLVPQLTEPQRKALATHMASEFAYHDTPRIRARKILKRVASLARITPRPVRSRMPGYDGVRLAG